MVQVIEYFIISEKIKGKKGTEIYEKWNQKAIESKANRSRVYRTVHTKLIHVDLQLRII